MSSTTGQPMQGVVLVQSNEHANNVIAFRRDDDGGLTPAGAAQTRGAGNVTAHLQSQGSVTITGDGRRVLVTNAGSGDLSVFGVATEGPIPRAVMATGQGADQRGGARRPGLRAQRRRAIRDGLPVRRLGLDVP
jgi:6-phosphogluconolactonase (cycloisomerase 2 family)